MTPRDGALISLWQGTTDTPYIPKSVSPTGLYDVAIAGGGITGLTLGLLLQRAGKRCILLEAHTLGFGTTGGTTAHLNTLLDVPYTTLIRNFGKDKATLVARAAHDAIDLIRSHVDTLGIDCGFEETPGYLFAQDDSQVSELESIYKACSDVGVAARYTDEIPVPVDFLKALEIPGQAKFHPLRYCYALAQAFEDAGGTIMTHCKVQQAEGDDDTGVTVQTSQGVIQSSALVYATHIPPGVNILHLRCPAYRSYAVAVRLDTSHYPEGLTYDMYDPYHYYRTQTIDGKEYLIVGGQDHKTGDDMDTNQCFRELESYVRKQFPDAEVAYHWSSQYFEPVDGLPYIGHMPGTNANVYVATGFGGNGMIYSHVAARVLKSMLLDEDLTYSTLFNPGRIKPVAGFVDFLQHNVHVAAKFAGQWFKQEDLQSLVDLAPGEARVVKYENHTIALYKDEQGALHAVNPTCTHMGCSVAWNSAEKSWDCPCHGARYSAEGEVLTGPADRALEVIAVKDLVERH